VVVALAAGAAILAAMICLSVYGWITLPSDAQVPIHFGVSYNNFVSKRVGLLMHTAAGAVAFIILLAMTKGGAASNSASTPPYVILPIIMVVMLAVQAGAIRVARQRAGG
jgi:hypothetical protein